MRLQKRVLGWSLTVALGATLAHDAKTAEINAVELQKLLQFYKPIQELDVGFKQIKHLKEMDLDLKSTGRLHVVRPDQVTWEILNPSPLRVVIAKDRVQIISGSGARKSVQTLEKNQLAGQNAAQAIAMISPWLLLDAPALAEHYGIDKLDAHHFVFTPKDLKLFSHVEVKLAADGHMESLILSELSGDSMSIQFEKPKILRSQP